MIVILEDHVTKKSVRPHITQEALDVEKCTNIFDCNNIVVLFITFFVQ